MRQFFAGVMSGTSQDGIDAVLAEFESGRFVRAVHHHRGAYAPELRSRLLELSREATPVALAELAILDRRVADAFADAVNSLPRASHIEAVGSHGQTVFHDAEGAANSLQLGDASRIAVRCGLPVVADFRRADIALGGQGAPLLPIFHHALFADAQVPSAVLNLGGIANLTLLPGDDPAQVRGFDCGPASCLLDEWVERHHGLAYDEGGQWAASGRVDAELLSRCLGEPYFARSLPKSTGRGLFNLDWLAMRDPDLAGRDPTDVQRTLAELTVQGVVRGLRAAAPRTRRLWVCGGGADNAFLMSRLGAELMADGIALDRSESRGLPAQWVEAAAFAWLACRRLRGEPGNLPSVTGASRPAVLGGLFHP